MPKTRSRIPDTFDELLAALGDIDPRRVRLKPPPGRGTVADVVRLNDRYGRLYELVDGTLVEKVMGFPESNLGLEVVYHLRGYLELHPIGELVGADGMMQIFPNFVRMPDVAFIGRDRLPGGRTPTEQVPQIVPDLAVEVISSGNTKGEMRRKLKEYFLAGVRVVWFVRLADRSVTVYSAPDVTETLRETDTLSGGDVLPGFRLPLAKLFARLTPPPTKRNGKKKPRR
jgi:Uma2 family endonuclease